jgi:hypothetical protein
LCGQPASEIEDLVKFPPIFANQRDPAFVVNDAVVHHHCLMERSYGPRALAKWEDYERRQRRPKICRVCGTVIGDPDDYFSLGPLSDFPDEPLARFDWLQAHLHCLRDTAAAAAPRFIANSAGGVLDTSRITIPEGKFGYLLENPSKAGVFSERFSCAQQNGR